LAAKMDNNFRQIDVLIIGAGRGGLALLDALSCYQWVKVWMMVDKSKDAIAFNMAASIGIPCSTDITSSIESFSGDLVINATGDANLVELLCSKAKSRKYEVITDAAAMLIYGLAVDQVEKDSVIHNQNSHLKLLEGMLDITSLLATKPDVEMICVKMMNHLHYNSRSVRGIGVIFKKSESAYVIGSTDANVQMGSELSTVTRAILQPMLDTKYYSWLKSPLQVSGEGGFSYFNIIVPFWENSELVGALLYDIQGYPTDEQKNIFQMGGVHLNMVGGILSAYQELEEIAIHDGLTKLYNRRFFDQKLEKEVSRIRRNSSAHLACAFIDVDDFKEINDSHGHQTGDLILQNIAHALEYHTREYDICARYGGDEFVILFPMDESRQDVHIEKIGLRILDYIRDLSLPDQSTLQTTLSIGIGIVSSQQLKASRDILSLADQALYIAKRSGKGQVKVLIG